MQNFFYVGVGRFCVGKKLLHTNRSVGSRVPLSKRCNVCYQDENTDGHDENDFGEFQDGVEPHPPFESRVKLTGRITWDYMNVEKPHFSSSSFKISIFFSDEPSF
jgi:hypothetical protein